MANVIVTFKIMPEGVEVNLKGLEGRIRSEITDFGGDVGKVELEPVAFGLQALKVFFVLDESKGNTELLEENIKAIDGVLNVEVIDVRRAIG